MSSDDLVAVIVDLAFSSLPLGVALTRCVVTWTERVGSNLLAMGDDLNISEMVSCSS
jgi:hypothetical protein